MEGGSTCTAVAGTQKGRSEREKIKMQGSGENGQWGLGDSQVRAGRRGGGKVNADEA